MNIVNKRFPNSINSKVGFISSTYKPKIVLLAVGLTAAIVVGLTIFAFQTRFDFTGEFNLRQRDKIAKTIFFLVCGGALCIILSKSFDHFH